MSPSLWILMIAGVCAAQELHFYTETKASPVKSVCVLPAEARMTRVGMKGGEGLVERSDEWADKLTTALQHAVAEAGGESISPGEDQSQVVLTLRQKYEGVSTQMRKKRSDVKKGRFTLGDEIALLPCAA